jgi:hypothetical protein
MRRGYFLTHARIISTALITMCELSVSCARGGSASASPSDVASSVVVPPGELDFKLPRAFCYPGSRVGDTVSAFVHRNVRAFLGSSDDAPLPSGLRAFMRVDRTGAATGLVSMALDFVVDSFVTASRHAAVSLRVSGYDVEGVMGFEVKPGEKQDCYGGYLKMTSKSDSTATTLTS